MSHAAYILTTLALSAVSFVAGAVLGAWLALGKSPGITVSEARIDENGRVVRVPKGPNQR